MTVGSNALIGERLLTTNFVVLCLVTLAFAFSFYFLMATLPPYVLEIGGTEGDVGLAMAAFAITAVVTRPIVGRWSDRWGPRRFIIAGGALMSATPVFYILTSAVPPLLGVRLLHGIAYAMAGTAAMSLIAETAPAARRGEAMGFFGMSGNAAMAAGPAVGVYTLQVSSFSVLFMVSAAVAAVSLVLSIGVRQPARATANGHASSQTGVLVADSRVLFPAAVQFLFSLTYGAIISFLPLYAGLRGIDNPGVFFTAFAIVVMALRGFAGQLSDRYGRAAAIVPGMACAAIGLGVLSFAADIMTFVSAAVLYGLAFALVQPALTAFAVDRVDPRSRGAATGTFLAALDLGAGLGSIVWGYLVQATGYEALYLASMGIAIVAMVVFLAGSGTLGRLPFGLGRS